MLPWHTQSSHHAPSPPARFADDQRSPPAGTFPYTPSMVLCSVQIPDPARSPHGGCISPWPPRIHPPANPPRVLPWEGARAGVPGFGGLSSGPAAPARLPGCGRCLLRLCPEPGHRSRRGAQPPPGSGAFQWYRSPPGHRSRPRVREVPSCPRAEPPEGTGAAGTRRVPTHGGALAAGTALGAAALLRSSPPRAVVSRSPGPPPRGPAGGAACSPPRCRGIGTGTEAEEGPRSPPALQSPLQWRIWSHTPHFAAGLSPSPPQISALVRSAWPPHLPPQ